MDLYRVIGNPVSHSLSPRIHSTFARLTGQDMCYEALKLEADEFVPRIQEMLYSGEIKGANITVPYKEQAWRLADLRSDRAELAGAVNTLYLDPDGRIVGENTDGSGLVSDLQSNLDFELNNARVLLVGAGGAVRGVIAPLLSAGVSQLVLTNRTLAKAQSLKDLFGDQRILVSEFEQVPEPAFDLIINGTSASLSGQLPPLPDSCISEATLAYDMMYGAEPTAFCRWASERGASAVDGLGMLVEQAADAFAIWRGVRPETAGLLTELRKELATRR